MYNGFLWACQREHDPIVDLNGSFFDPIMRGKWVIVQKYFGGLEVFAFRFGVFGSFAKGRAGSESDVDIIVELLDAMAQLHEYQSLISEGIEDCRCNNMG